MPARPAVWITGNSNLGSVWNIPSVDDDLMIDSDEPNTPTWLVLGAITWHPGIGDPTLSAWIITVGYGISALLCIWRGSQSASKSHSDTLVNCNQVLEYRVDPHPPAKPWFVFGGILILLGGNKQLDFQTLLIQLGRELSVALGWYPERRVAQFTFVLAVAAVAITGTIVYLRVNREFSTNNPLALIGIALSLLYILIRSAEFNHADRRVGPNWSHGWPIILEFVSIVCMAAAAGRSPRTDERASYS